MVEIRRYVEAHPHAIDSISGVHAFWLSRSGGAVSIELLQAALDVLTEAGVLEARRIPGGEVIYGASGSRKGRPTRG